MRAIVPVFVTGVSFPRKGPGDINRAWVEFQDDADGHAFRIAMPTESVKALLGALEVAETDEEDGAIVGTLILEIPGPEPTP